MGNDRGFSVKEVIETAKKITGKDFMVVDSARRPGDPAVLNCISDKTRHVLGWKPSHDGIDDIIRTDRNWFQRKFV